MGNIKIVRGVFDTKLELEHAGVAAGFPSPADDYTHDTLDFNRDYIRHPEAFFYGDVEGDSMKDAGIFDGDRVIIDRAVEPHDGSIVIAWGGGEGCMNSLFSASHGAGRTMSRQDARNTFSRYAMKKFLAEKNVTLIGGTTEEAPLAYKNIGTVMESQRELVHIEGKLIPRIVRMSEE